MNVDARRQRIEAYVERNDKDRLVAEAVSAAGLPDEPEGLRARVWRCLLELPVELSEQYAAFLSAVSPSPSSVAAPGSLDDRHSRVLREIRNDVHRTSGGGLAWFNKLATHIEPDDAIISHGTTSSSRSSPLLPLPTTIDSPDSTKRPLTATSEEDDDQDSFVTPPGTPKSSQTPAVTTTTNRDALVRPLFVFAVLNPAISYVQGMNAVVAVLNYTFAQSLPPLEAEAAAFFALGKLVNQIQDLYIVQSTNETVRKVTKQYIDTLKWADEHVLAALEDKQIEPLSFVFRWITTLFAQEFALPDVQRIWDRLIALSVPGNDDMSAHLVDLAVALTLEERLVITSPYADFDRCIKTLQDPQLDGAQVDALIATAWDIRDRRKLRESGVPEWRIAAARWTNGAAASLRERFKAQTDDDDDMNAVEVPVLQVDGHVLPLPPSADDATPATSSWLGSFTSRLSSSDAAAHLAKHRTNLSISASRLATSDTAASLSKASTNLSAQASLLSTQIATQAPERLNKIRSNVQAASSRFMASTGSSQSPVRRPGSPVEPPFTPPTHYAGGGDSPGMSRRPLSPAPYTAAAASSSMYDTTSHQAPFSGPKPLLLSSSTGNTSPTERRTSMHLRSPSTSPTGLRTSISVAPLGHQRSPSPVHRPDADEVPVTDERASPVTPRHVTASAFQVRQPHPRRASASSPATATSLRGGNYFDEDVPISSLRLQNAQQDETTSEPNASTPSSPSLAGAPRLRRSAAAVRRRSSDYSSLGVGSSTRGGTTGSTGAVPSKEGRGWSLVDRPSLSVDTTTTDIAHGAYDGAALESVSETSPITLHPDRRSSTTSNGDARPPRKSSLAPSPDEQSARPRMYGGDGKRRDSARSLRSIDSSASTSASNDESSLESASATAPASKSGKMNASNKEKRRSVSEFLIQKTRPAAHKRASSSSNHQQHHTRTSITDVLDEYY